MKLWIDDVRPAPDGYYWLKSVLDAELFIQRHEEIRDKHYHLAVQCFNKGDEVSFFQHIEIGAEFSIELIDIDHDAGDYASSGGDYIKLLDWLEETGRSYPIRIHSMNPVGVENMRVIIERNGWVEVF